MQYTARNILCIELLRMEGNGYRYDIIQDYDPFAWDVTNGNQKWVSKTNKKISYWTDNCIEDDRILTQTIPFAQSCHDRVEFSGLLRHLWVEFSAFQIFKRLLLG